MRRVDARPPSPPSRAPTHPGARAQCHAGVTCQLPTCRCAPVSPPMRPATLAARPRAKPDRRQRRTPPTRRATAAAARHALPGQHGRRPVGERPRRSGAAASTRGSSSSSATRCTPRPTSRSTAPAASRAARRPSGARSRGCCRRPTSSTSSSASRSCPRSLQFPMLRLLRQEVRHALPRLGHPRQDAGAARLREEGRSRDRRQLRRDPLGARGGGDPARASTSRGSRPRRPPTGRGP